MAKDTFHFKQMERDYWNSRLNTAYSNYKKAVKAKCEGQGMTSSEACQQTRVETVKDTVKVNVFRQGISIDMSNGQFAEMKNYIRGLENYA